MSSRSSSATGAARSRSARTLALAAYLVVHAGTPQSRQRIASLFWSESTDAQALTNLRRELHNLRHALAGEACLEVTARDLCWHDGGAVHVDLRVFDLEYRAAQRSHAAGDATAVLAHAAVALGVYRGDLLPGVYDDWVPDARAELQEQCVQLCASVCMIGIERGEFAAALDAARMRIRLRPFEEVGYRVLMQLQAGLGDRAAAVSTYHRCASVLERELGVEPDEATRGAVAQLLARSRQADRSRHPCRGRPGPARFRFSVGPGSSACCRQRGSPLRSVGQGWCSSGAAPVWGRAASSPRSPRPPAGRAAWRPAPSASQPRGGWLWLPIAEWLRSPEVQVGVAGLDPVWRAGGGAAGALLAPGGASPCPALGGAGRCVAASPLLRGRGPRAAWASGGRCCWCWTTCSGVTRRRWRFLTFCFGLFPDAPVLLAATPGADRPRGRARLGRGWTSICGQRGFSRSFPSGRLERRGHRTSSPKPSGVGRCARWTAELLVAVHRWFSAVTSWGRCAPQVGHGSVPAGDLDAVLAQPPSGRRVRQARGRGPRCGGRAATSR